MKRDSEVLLMRRERAKGRTQEQAAARAGMSVRTLRRYERRGKLPSQFQEPRAYRTRPNPFAEDWSWITSQLERDPALQGTTLFGLLKELRRGRYQARQLRTLRRQIVAWRAQYRPGCKVIVPQIHESGEAARYGIRIAQQTWFHQLPRVNTLNTRPVVGHSAEGPASAERSTL
jgi:transcriptional regulator with XRE-family HTH domain